MRWNPNLRRKLKEIETAEFSSLLSLIENISLCPVRVDKKIHNLSPLNIFWQIVLQGPNNLEGKD